MAMRDIVVDLAVTAITIAGGYLVAHAVFAGFSGGFSWFRRTSIRGKAMQLNSYEAKIAELLVDKNSLDASLDQVGGHVDVTTAIRESVVWPFNHPELFPPSLRKPVMGMLLHGPPGTGKTLIARALAAECHANFLEIKVEALFAKWVGDSERYVAAVFSLARKIQPVILFVDEIDSLLGSRDLSDHSSEQNAKAIFLREWDGIVSAQGVRLPTGELSPPRIIVVGATNMPHHLDRAILRRLPLKFEIGLPDADAREQILRLHIVKAAKSDRCVGESEAAAQRKGLDRISSSPDIQTAPILIRPEIEIGSDVSIAELAAATAGYSGADLEQLVREARMLPAREAARETIRRIKESGAAATFEPVRVRRPGRRDFEAAMQQIRATSSFGAAPTRVKRFVS